MTLGKKIRNSVIVIVTLLIAIFLIVYALRNLNTNKSLVVFNEKTVTIMIRESRYTDAFKYMIKKTYVEHNIRVNVQVVPDAQGDTIIEMKAKTGTIPDLIDANIPHVYGLLNPPSYFEDLSDQPWVLQLKNKDNFTYSDGNIYGFPFQENSGIAGILYNKDVFEEYELQVPTTQQEFVKICELLKANDIFPVLMCKDTWVPQMWMNYGYPLSIGNNDDCNAMASNILNGYKRFADYPELEEPLDVYLNLFEQNYVNEDYRKIDYDEMIDLFGKGKGAMIMGYSGMLGAIEANNQSTNFGMFLPPFSYVKEDVVVNPAYSIGLCVMKDSENKEVAKELLNIWATSFYLSLWFEKNSGFPSIEGVEGGTLNSDVEQLYNDYVLSGKTVNEYMLYLEPYYALNSDKAWIYYIEAPEKGETAEEIMRKLQEDIDQYK